MEYVQHIFGKQKDILEDVEPLLARDKFMTARDKLASLPMQYEMDDAQLLDLKYLKSILPFLFLNKRAILFINVHGQIPLHKYKEQHEPIPETFIIPKNFTIKYGSIIKPGLCNFGTTDEIETINNIDSIKPHLLNYAESPEMDNFNNVDSYMLSILKNKVKFNCEIAKSVKIVDDKNYKKFMHQCRTGDIKITTAEPGDEMVNYNFIQDEIPNTVVETLMQFYKPNQIFRDVLLFVKYVHEPLHLDRIFFNDIIMNNYSSFTTLEFIVSFFQNYSAIEELIIFDDSCSTYYLASENEFIDTTNGLLEEIITRSMIRNGVKYGGSHKRKRKNNNKKTKKKILVKNKNKRI